MDAGEVDFPNRSFQKLHAKLARHVGSMYDVGDVLKGTFVQTMNSDFFVGNEFGFSKVCGKVTHQGRSFDLVGEMDPNPDRSLLMSGKHVCGSSQGQREIASRAIGRMVLDELRTLDNVAYLRFASVYQETASLDDFMRLLQPLIGKEQ